MAKCSLWADFKAFAIKGNFIDMAVGVVVGGAFGKIVTSLVNDIIMPLIGWLVGGVDLSSLKVALRGNLSSKVVDHVGIDANATDLIVSNTEEQVAYLTYGKFLQEILDFFIIAFCIFLCVRLIGKLNAKLNAQKIAEEKAAAAAAAAAPAPKSEDVVLLEEIRDLLKNKK